MASRPPGGDPRPATRPSGRPPVIGAATPASRAVQMAEQIHLTVVAVAEPTVCDRGRNACGKIAERLDADVAAAAQNCAGQPGTAELRPGDDAHLDCRRRRPARRWWPSAVPVRAARCHEDRRPMGEGASAARSSLRRRAAETTYPLNRAHRTCSRCRRRPTRPRWSTGSLPAVSDHVTQPSRARRRHARREVRHRGRRQGARTRHVSHRVGRSGFRNRSHPSPPAPMGPRRRDGESAGPAVAGPHREPAILFPLCRCG